MILAWTTWSFGGLVVYQLHAARLRLSKTQAETSSQRSPSAKHLITKESSQQPASCSCNVQDHYAQGTIASVLFGKRSNSRDAIVHMTMRWPSLSRRSIDRIGCDRLNLDVSHGDCGDGPQASVAACARPGISFSLEDGKAYVLQRLI